MSFTPSSLRNKFEECLKNDDLSDCEFLVGKQKCRIKGHRLLFGVSSPAFRDLLYADSKNISTFQIADVEVDEFNCMKQFFYTDSIDFTSCLHACLVYSASWRYVVPDLMTKCVNYIKDNISASEVIKVYEFSRHHNSPDIETICSAVFQDKTRDVMESEQFLSAEIHTLETILKLDTLKLRSELEVFKYAERWVFAEVERKKIGSEQLREYFDPIIKQIRFLTMSRDQYQQGPYESDLLTGAEKLFIAHSLLGLEDRSTQKFCAETKHRVFTEVGEGQKEEEVDDDEEEIENREGGEDKKEGEKREKNGRDGIVQNQVDNLQQSVSKILLPNNAILSTNAVTFKFVFDSARKIYDFIYQGLAFQIYYHEQTLSTKPLKTRIVWITLVNRHKVKLHSESKMEIYAWDGRCAHKESDSFSIIKNYEHTFTYSFDVHPNDLFSCYMHRFELTLLSKI